VGPRLKNRPEDSDLRHVAELSCPVCNADLPLAGDERVGDDVYCSYCGAPLVLRGKPGADFEDMEPEEDF
jgi:predicted amidophosphoribosyltransferase